MFSFNMVGPTALVYMFSERLEWFKTLLSSIYIPSSIMSPPEGSIPKNKMEIFNGIFHEGGGGLHFH